MKIIEKKLDDLRPYENNPRNNAAAVEPVMHSIQQFGFKVPLVIDKDGTIVTGHTRLLAAKELGMEKVPCIVADDLTEDQVNAFRLADNKVAEASSWDWGKLEEELARMEIAEIDMAVFGFDMPEFNSGISEDAGISDFFEAAPGTPDFFEAAPGTPESNGAVGGKKTKTVTCPHCGEVFEI